MTDQSMVHWAHVDAEGRIQSWGSAVWSAVFLQPLAEGRTAVVRPVDVNGFEPWRYKDGEWIKDPA